jgi:hypothetical protein
LAGYAVECGLKSKLARQFKASTTPLKSLVNDIHVHDLQKLVRLADMDASLRSLIDADPEFEVAWSVVKDWSETSRYRTWNEREARDMVDSVSGRSHGVMKWVRRHW